MSTVGDLKTPRTSKVVKEYEYMSDERKNMITALGDLDSFFKGVEKRLVAL